MESDTLTSVDDSTLKANSKHLQIRAAQVKQLYSQGQSGLIGALLGAAVLTAALWSVAPQFLLILWLAGYVLVCLARQILLISYQRSVPPVDQAIGWEKWFAILSFTGALFWGLAGVFLFPVHSIPHQFLLAVFVTGISCGAAEAYWPSRSCYVPAILVELLPLSGRFIYEGDEVHIIIGMVIALFAVVLTVMANHMHSMNSETLESRFEKSSLADSLEKARDELELKVKERTAELEESKGRFQNLVESTSDWVWETDDKGVYTYVSPRILNILGYEPAEVLDKNVCDFMDREEADRIVNILTTIVPSRKPFSCIENTGLHKNGLRVLLETSGIPLFNKDGQFSGYRGITRDVTSRKQAEDELKRAWDELEARVKERTTKLLKANEKLEAEVAERERAEQELQESHQRLEHALAVASQLRVQAEAASAAKSEFLTNMSHELRTPLNVILGFSELLQDQWPGELNEKQLEYTREIFEAGHHLLQLINDILDLAKVESGTIDLRISTVDLAQLLNNCLTMTRERAIRRDLTLDLAIPEELSETKMRADEVKLKQIIVNLLSNAAKFTPGGGRIKLETEKKGDELLITVADTGIGIRPEDQTKIFEAFEQVDSSFSRRERGTGLGLALARRLVEIHGGRIWVESEGEGKGSTFRFVIPLVMAGKKTTECAQSLDAVDLTDRLSQTTDVEDEVRQEVLVVEDDPDNMKLATNLLEVGGYKVLRAYSAEEGIRIAENESPALILMDISLPGMDGLTATRVLKQTNSTAHIPVVALTAHAMKEDEARAREAGCDAYLTKPMDTRTFYMTLAGFVKAAKEEAAAE